MAEIDCSKLNYSNQASLDDTCPTPRPTGKNSRDCTNLLAHNYCISEVNKCISRAGRGTTRVPPPVQCCNNVVNIVEGQILNSEIAQSCALGDGTGTGGGASGGGVENKTKFDSKGKMTDIESDGSNSGLTQKAVAEDSPTKYMIPAILLIILCMCSMVALVLVSSD